MFPDIDELAPRVAQMCEEVVPKVEFRTFLLGVRAKELALEVPADTLRQWKGTLKCRVGNLLGDRWEGEREVDFHRPDVQLIYDMEKDRVWFEPRAIYLYGRYRKLAHDMPQTNTNWRCLECAGKRLDPPCPACEGTGRRYQVALGDLVGRPCREVFRGKRYSFHGMGREDVDVRCLGTGRPFVLEVNDPLVRTVDLEALTAKVQEDSEGRVELSAPFQRVSVDMVARVKGWEADKTYLAVCASESPPSSETVAALRGQLTGQELEQRTPVRVSKRRADLVRRRTVVSFEPGALEGDRFEATVKAQAGTYIKELISGDEGRTQPSVSGLLGIPTLCAQLTVMGIHVTDQELLEFDG